MTATASAPAPQDDREILRLGLIGDHIHQSRSPALHRLAGQLEGRQVTYDLFVPPEMGLSFDAVFDAVRDRGLRGVNVTYPYKERVLGRIAVDDPFVRSIGSVNTVLFDAGGPHGFNTDYSGFVAAYRSRFGTQAPGTVVVVGTGGVGRAVAFGLATLGAAALRLVDRDTAKAEALAQALAGAFGPTPAVSVSDRVEPTLDGASGAVNCTPMGMGGEDRSALPADRLSGLRWAFDAVYTPVETRFKRDCDAAGVAFLSGYELFFHQGVDAFRIFSGSAAVDAVHLREALAGSAVAVAEPGAVAPAAD